MRARILLAGVGIMIVVWSSHSLRRRFIATFFLDGPRATGPRWPSARPDPTPVPPSVPQLRVLLVDGLSMSFARGLATTSRFCETGLDLTLDVGFPTVSLPVQGALWTAHTQQQTGWLYRVKGLAAPPPEALPVRLGTSSVAVAEEQGYIAGSFGFTDLRATHADEAAFVASAQQAMEADARLAFVHVLRVDKAGHRGGAASDGYRAAALWADALLGRLLQAAPPGPDRRWVVLSDHGHRTHRRGGHAGAETEVRFVRACVAGGGIQAAVGTIHLVDLSRLLFDSLAVAPAPGSSGRPLGEAIATAARDATMPDHSRSPTAWLVGLGVVLLAVASSIAAARWVPPGRGRWVGLWFPLSLASVVAIYGVPTLSNPIIYPPLGLDVMLAALPGLLALSAFIAAATLAGSASGLRLAATAMMPALLGALASWLACGGLGAVVLGPSAAGPPLADPTSALASVCLVLVTASGIAVGASAGLTAAMLSLRARWRQRRPDPH